MPSKESIVVRFDEKAAAGAGAAERDEEGLSAILAATELPSPKARKTRLSRAISFLKGTKGSGDAAFRLWDQKVWCVARRFETPLQPIRVSGGTAGLYNMQTSTGFMEKGEAVKRLTSDFVLKPNTCDRYWIGKDVTHAPDELTFYNTLRNFLTKWGLEDPSLAVFVASAFLSSPGMLRLEVAPAPGAGSKKAAKESGPHVLPILLMQNMFHGFARLRFIDLKLGRQTAVGRWKGKSKFAAWRNQMVDTYTNSCVEGYRLEGMEAPPTMEIERLLRLHKSFLSSTFLSKKKLARMMYQSLDTPGILPLLLDMSAVRVVDDTDMGDHKSHSATLLETRSDKDSRQGQIQASSETEELATSEDDDEESRSDLEFFPLHYHMRQTVGHVETSADDRVGTEDAAHHSGVDHAAADDLPPRMTEAIRQSVTDLESSHLTFVQEHTKRFRESWILELYVERVLRRLLVRVMETVTGLVRRFPFLPQMWIGSSVGLGFEAGTVYAKDILNDPITVHLPTPDGIPTVAKLFDWGRSEFNTEGIMRKLMPLERAQRLKYWTYYLQALGRLGFELSRHYLHRFGPKNVLFIELVKVGAHGGSQTLHRFSTVDLQAQELLFADKKEDDNNARTVTIPLESLKSLTAGAPNTKGDSDVQIRFHICKPNERVSFELLRFGTDVQEFANSRYQLQFVVAEDAAAGKRFFHSRRANELRGRVSGAFVAEKMPTKQSRLDRKFEFVFPDLRHLEEADQADALELQVGRNKKHTSTASPSASPDALQGGSGSDRDAGDDGPILDADDNNATDTPVAAGNQIKADQSSLTRNVNPTAGSATADHSVGYVTTKTTKTAQEFVPPTRHKRPSRSGSGASLGAPEAPKIIEQEKKLTPVDNATSHLGDKTGGFAHSDAEAAETISAVDLDSQAGFCHSSGEEILQSEEEETVFRIGNANKAPPGTIHGAESSDEHELGASDAESSEEEEHRPSSKNVFGEGRHSEGPASSPGSTGGTGVIERTAGTRIFELLCLPRTELVVERLLDLAHKDVDEFNEAHKSVEGERTEEGNDNTRREGVDPLCFLSSVLETPFLASDDTFLLERRAAFVSEHFIGLPKGFLFEQKNAPSRYTNDIPRASAVHRVKRGCCSSAAD
ncbi:unnamed protein product [Amoebophrya sp. A25]|nr:unnamed protein product [Amoebophrya sp. A25]|eukprot:GSA25T00005188001.1